MEAGADVAFVQFAEAHEGGLVGFDTFGRADFLEDVRLTGVTCQITILCTTIFFIEINMTGVRL